MLNLTPEEMNIMFPVVGIIAYPGGVVIRRECNLNLGQLRHLHLRGNISVVNKRSLNNLALLVKSCEVTFTSVMTLTYGGNYPFSGKVAKKHLNHFLVQSKRVFGDYSYIWVLEFQERGAVHFHIATTLPAPTKLQSQQFAEMWLKISLEGDWWYCELLDVGGTFARGQNLSTKLAGYSVHRHPKAWEALRKSDGLGRYMAKYANKLRQKVVPPWYSDVGRFWGASRHIKLPEGKYYSGNEAQVRQALEYGGRNVAHWKVLPRVVLL